MDILKKRLIPIICGIVAIICVVLIFFPFSGMYESLTGEVAASKQVGEQIQQVKKSPRTWPTLSSHEEDRQPLTAFPTAATISLGEEMTKGWTTTAENFKFRAVDLQQKSLTPLVPDALPGTSSGSGSAYAFQDAYMNRFGLKTDPSTGKKNTSRAIWNTILKRPADTTGQGSGMPPTAEEIAAQQTAVAAAVTARVERKISGVVANGPEVADAVARATAKVAQNMRAAQARSYVVYIDPQTSLTSSQKIAGVQAPGVNDIFEAQVALWIQEDFCRAIAEVNKDAKEGVVDAKIKRLVKLTVLPRYVPVPPAAGAAATPATVPPLPTAKVTMDYKKTPLGQQSNDLYDVVRFEAELVIDAEHMPETLAGLSEGRYAMFLNAEMMALDSSVAQAQGFLYGNKPVISVKLDGQYLLLRPFIGPFMPPDIIRGLTAPADAAAGGGAAPYPGAPGMGGRNESEQ